MIELISDYQNNNVPIINHGVLDKSEVTNLYLSSEYLIYPSLLESFGLPLIEAIICDCKVLASNRAYVKEICEPSLIFDPLDLNNISGKNNSTIL